MLGRVHAQARKDAESHPALTDANTGLPNRLYFELVFNYLFEAGNRGMPFTVMLVSAGSTEKASDAELRTLGQTVQNTTRYSDLVSHVGAGRYVILLLGTNLQGARIAADRIETALEGVAPGVVSFGMSAYTPDIKESQELLDAVDDALLAAEAAGGGVEFG